MHKFALPLALLLNACVPVTPADTPTRAYIPTADLPPMKTFGAPKPTATQKSNSDIALDFIELGFQLESGRALPIFTRFEGPITLRVTGAPPVSLTSDLNRLVYRLDREAGIKLNQVPASQPANITIEAVSRAEIRDVLPNAACFVVPNISTISEYKTVRRTSKAHWSALKTRERVAIFLPNDASPQEVRDCLHEELAQALGPLNDLYRLPDSVFNDDNVHTVLTGFDMLILKTYYDPALKSGMTRGQVAQALPSILNRINPLGEGRPVQFSTRTPAAWSESVQGALAHGAKPGARRKAAERALKISRTMGWTDHRRAFAHYAMGRVLLGTDPNEAQNHFNSADRFYAGTPGAALHRAYVATQLAAYAISQGDGERAILLINPQLELAAQNENAALLSTLMLLRAEALELAGRSGEATTVRLDSLGWARYGFGPDWAVRAKLREIGALNPLNDGRG
ncbi:MAG: DUF2927 domain-containing protein [Paracoccaceae bacterium]